MAHYITELAADDLVSQLLEAARVAGKHPGDTHARGARERAEGALRAELAKCRPPDDPTPLEETPMTFDEYQALAQQTAIYPGQGGNSGLAYVALGLNGEAGEVAELIKKHLRDDRGYLLSEGRREALIKEAGDVLWYLSMLGAEVGFSLEDAAKWNLEKLESRQQRGVLGGSGNDR